MSRVVGSTCQDGSVASVGIRGEYYGHCLKHSFSQNIRELRTMGCRRLPTEISWNTPLCLQVLFLSIERKMQALDVVAFDSAKW